MNGPSPFAAQIASLVAAAKAAKKDEQGPVDYSGIQVAPGPDDAPMSAPVTAAPAPASDNDDVLARLEQQTPDLNTRVQLSDAEKRLAAPIVRPTVSIAPPQPPQRTDLVPKEVYDIYGHHTVMVDPKTGEAPSVFEGAFKNPLQHGPVTYNSTTGHDVDPATGKDIIPSPKVAPSGPPAYITNPAPYMTQQPAAVKDSAHAGAAHAPAGPKPPSVWDLQRRAMLAQQQAALAGVEDQTVAHAQAGQALGDEAARMQRDAEANNAEAKRLADEADKQSKLASEMKIDPSRFWSHQGVGAKAAFLVADAIAGFSAGLNGGQNIALEQANNLVNQDINAQAAAIEQGHKRAADMRGAVAEFYERTKNLEQAKQLAFAASMDKMKEQAAAYSAGSQSQMVQANTQKALADLEMQRQIALAKAAAAAQKKGPTLKDVRELSNAMEKEHIVSGEQALKRVQELAASNGGEIPGTGVGGRIAGSLANAHIPLVSSLANLARGTDARQVDGALTAIAEAQAQANGQRGTEAVLMNKEAIIGNGSQEDLSSGIARAMKNIQARKANIRSGYDPEVVQAQETLKDFYTPPDMPEGFKPAGSK